MGLKTINRLALCALIAAPLNAGAFVGVAAADSYVRCESRNNRHEVCPISTGKHGYVRMTRQLGRHACIQGRTWDYDKHRIWVDDNCRAEFLIEERDGSGSKAATAAAVIGALAITAAIASAHKKDKDDDYDGYHGGGHSSYVAPWMVGEFAGYNERFRAPVDLSITSDGRASAHTEGQRVRGYVNGGRLYVGDHEFYISRVDGGIQTTQVDDPRNVVFYRRR